MVDNMFGKNDIEKNIRKGNISLKRGFITNARDYYLKALAIEPNNIEVLNNLALAYLMLNEENKAKGYYELLLKECNKQLEIETTPTILGLKANALIFLNQRMEANDVESEILKIEPDNIIALIQKSQYYELNNDYENALTYIDRILTINEEDIPTLLSKGRVLFNLGEFEKAELYYNKVLEKENKNIPALHLKSELIKAKTNCSETPHDLTILALNCWEKEDFENALKLMNKALKIDDRYDEIHFIQAELYIHTSQINKAIKSFEKAFEINPTSGGIKNQKKLFKFLFRLKKINKFIRLEK